MVDRGRPNLGIYPLQIRFIIVAFDKYFCLPVLIWDGSVKIFVNLCKDRR